MSDSDLAAALVALNDAIADAKRYGHPANKLMHAAEQIAEALRQHAAKAKQAAWCERQAGMIAAPYDDKDLGIVRQWLRAKARALRRGETE